MNLAPYSFFNAVCGAPPMIAFSSEGMKDSAAFAIETREFVVEHADVGSARGHERHLGVARARRERVRPRRPRDGAVADGGAAPRRGDARARWSARSPTPLNLSDVDGNDTDRHLVVGQVVGVHLDERYIGDDGILDVAAMRPIARCGYTADYTVLDRLFQMERPR